MQRITREAGKESLRNEVGGGGVSVSAIVTADDTAGKMNQIIFKCTMMIQSLTKQLSHAKTWKFVSVHHQIVQILPYNHYILILKPLFCMIDDRYSKS